MNDFLQKERFSLSLEQAIFEEPYRFEFFQLMRLLERIFRDKSPVGYNSLPENEVANFRSTLSLEFPASEVQEIKKFHDEILDRERTEVFVNFMGMLGLLGAMPMRYTELAAERARYGDTALWYFLDIFTHRAISLFYRAWVKYHFPVTYERGSDEFTEYVFCLIGLGTAGLRGRMFIDDESLLPYAGIINQKPHSAVALRNLIADYFEVSVNVIQFFGEWLELEEESLTRIGVQNNKIGINTIVGSRIWHNQSKFRLQIGPLTFKQYITFLPIGDAYKALKSIVKLFVGDEFDFDIQLKLRAKEVPSTILTTIAKRRPMLGWTSFLKTKPFTADADQLVLTG